MPNVWPAPCVACSIKAFMTDKNANGGTWTSSNTKLGCTPRCHAWPAATAARQHRHRSPGRARAVASLHCLKRWLCLCAGSCPCAQEKGPAPADAMLHALTVTYPTPYRAMETAEVKAVLDRVFGYLDRTTPAELISKSSGAAVTDLWRTDPETVLKPGDFRLT
eukprot:gene20228-39915_t